MAEVLELEKVEAEQESSKVEKDTWILKLPSEVCEREGFAEGTMISLTFKNAGIQSAIIHRTAKARESAKRFIGKYGDFMKEMERIGD